MTKTSKKEEVLTKIHSETDGRYPANKFLRLPLWACERIYELELSVTGQLKRNTELEVKVRELLYPIKAK